VRLDAFVPWGQALTVVRAIAEIFRDSDVLRQNREKARLKFLFLQHGWTAERFRTAIEERLGSPLQPGVPDDPPDDVYRDHVGIHAQKQPGLSYAGVAVLRGRLTADQMHAAADLAERYGTGALRTTHMQNLLIPNVRRERVHALARDLETAGFALDASPFRRGTVACTGSEFCKLALTETKGFARGLVETLEQRLPGFDQHLKIHITGCPNSCGQHWIADLGIEGKKAKVGGALVDAYYFCVGGAVGRHQAAALAEGIAERRLGGHGLAAGVDQPGADRFVLGPGWDQAPTQLQQMPGAGLVKAEDRRRLSRRDVVAGLQIGPFGKLEQVPQPLHRRRQVVASAHLLENVPSPARVPARPFSLWRKLPPL